MKQIWKQVKINDKNFSKVHFLKIPTVQLLLIFFCIIVCSGFVACGGNDNNEDNKTEVPTALAIDLGLPSGTQWANCNVGATKPEDYGDYFAWGETKAKKEYSWTTYKWYSNVYNGLTKYNSFRELGTVDGKDELDLTDDAAYVNWGGNWQTPSEEQIGELLKECLWTWTQLNGVNGYQVKSKTNGNSIFLPVGGWYGGISLNHDGMYGYYWSRSLYKHHSTQAFFLYLYVTNVRQNRDLVRYHGYNVRPVRRQS
ncbi:MAG: hypothetical protein IKH48_03245 [Prevotella sp.]|nr:hypothetical protein [Prevotella sp.]MBR7087362.1 hypothetical protein [Prevotella sp.]